jgi:GINS complex subunit 2
MDPSEIEFLGEKKLVSIVPNFNFDMIHLISGSVGPFRAGLPVKVPIWLAMCLKQKQKCRVINQEWMDLEGLNEKKETEKMSKYIYNSMKFVCYLIICLLHY